MEYGADHALMAAHKPWYSRMGVPVVDDPVIKMIVVLDIALTLRRLINSFDAVPARDTLFKRIRFIAQALNSS